MRFTNLDEIGLYDGEAIVDLLSLGYVYKLNGSADRSGNSILVFPKDLTVSPSDFVKILTYIKKR